MLPLTHLQQAKPQPERQYSSQGFSSSRSGTPALDSLSAYEADATAARGLSHQSSALQPSFRSVLQPKQYRPVSRDSGNSAWAAPQHSPSELQGPRHMSLDRPPSNAASRLPVTRQHASRQSTASPATSVQRPASVQRQQSAARPASMQRQQSGARPASEQRMQSAARPASRQQLQSASTRAACKFICQRAIAVLGVKHLCVCNALACCVCMAFVVILNCSDSMTRSLCCMDEHYMIKAAMCSCTVTMQCKAVYCIMLLHNI